MTIRSASISSIKVSNKKNTVSQNKLSESSIKKLAPFINISPTHRTGPFQVAFAVVAGGGGKATTGVPSRLGGGGGGYRASYAGEPSGGGASAETVITLERRVDYSVTVGAGGAVATQGNNSILSTVTSIGGGHVLSLANPGGGASGGSGGSGAGGNAVAGGGGAGTPDQGRNGQAAYVNSNGDWLGGGGGGAVNAGGYLGGNSRRIGGNGVVTSSITGTSTEFSRGGDGGVSGTTSPANTGGGASNANTPGADGIVSILIDAKAKVSISLGLSATETVVGDNKRIVFTAGTGTIRIS